MFNKVVLMGKQGIDTFLEISKTIPEDVYVTTRDRSYRVNGKSYLGLLLAASEWNDDTWIETNADVYFKFQDFIDVAEDDNVSIHK
nr:MAG: PTS HPr component phosphorylation site [Bacteriophage sp.]